MKLFKISTILVLFITLLGCRSAQELIQVAKHRDPNVILCKDSIVETITPGKIIIVNAKDTATINDDKVFIQAIADSNGVHLFYELKADTTSSKETTPVIIPKKTRQEVRQENKTQRNEANQNGKTARKKEITKKSVAKSHAKEIKYEERNNWWAWLLIGFGIGVIVTWLFMTKILRK